MAVYGYCRVSTTRQVAEGESLDVQERRIMGHAQANDLTITKVFVERGVSGGIILSERPAGAELVKILETGDVIIGPKLDRLFRSAHDALDMAKIWRKQGVSLHLLDLGGDVMNGLGKVFFTIAAAFAEAERDRTKERILEVKADQRERGRYLGGKVPFGRDVVAGDLVKNEGQQQAIQIMQAWRAEGKSYRKIAAMAQEELGYKLSHAGVKKIILAA